MYQINPTTNELIEPRAKRFGELGFREKEHLQEWLANCPTALGEDLLIIQKGTPKGSFRKSLVFL